jgi:hypothetical protein
VGYYAQGQSNAFSPKKSVARMKKSLVYLASDKLEGRQTGTSGEKLAYEYIGSQFKKAGLLPLGDSGTYLQAFEVSSKEKREGHNVLGFIDNHAPSTIVLGAHFDHLGYGQDKNSLYSDSVPMIHNGADDNASGTSMLIELSKWLKKSSLKKYNFLLVSFSGEELGLFGSKYLTEHFPLPISQVNCMINMDMVGRLNDSSHSISIGGFGTSPAWGDIVKANDAYLRIKLDSSGMGPSDHASFYKKDIPVLFFFTGTHSDYHKPSDDADKINFTGMSYILSYVKNVLSKINSQDKMSFLKTRDVSTGSRSFKVSLGIMPDYTFNGSGVHVDGVSSGKPAEKAGILKGDIILKLGDFDITDVESYMKALGKFEKGQTISVKVKRGDAETYITVTL